MLLIDQPDQQETGLVFSARRDLDEHLVKLQGPGLDKVDAVVGRCIAEGVLVAGPPPIDYFIEHEHICSSQPSIDPSQHFAEEKVLPNKPNGK